MSTTEQERIGIFEKFSVSPKTTLEMLTSIRNGQPIPLLMKMLSEEAALAIRYLQQEFRLKNHVIKMIIGDPGAGKSTFKQLLISEVKRMDSDEIVPVECLIYGSSHFKSIEFVANLVINKRLLLRSVQKIKIFKHNFPDQYAKIKSRCQEMANGHLFYFILNSYEKIIESYERLDDFLFAVNSWLTDGVKAALKNQYLILGDFEGRIPDKPTSSFEIVSFLSDFIEFYQLLEIYPVWLIDEFESIVLLYNGIQGKSKALSIFREFIDIVCSEKGTGSIVFFSTRDGYRLIEEYPALGDRLKGSNNFTLSNIVWNINHFSKWEAKDAFNIIIDLYRSSAIIDPLVSAKVIQNLSIIDEPIQSAIYSILESNIEPRKRLKEVIVNLLDLLSAGKSGLQKIDFLKQNIENDHQAVSCAEETDQSFQEEIVSVIDGHDHVEDISNPIIDANSWVDDEHYHSFWEVYEDFDRKEREKINEFWNENEGAKKRLEETIIDLTKSLNHRHIDLNTVITEQPIIDLPVKKQPEETISDFNTLLAPSDDPENKTTSLQPNIVLSKNSENWLKEFSPHHHSVLIFAKETFRSNLWLPSGILMEYSKLPGYLTTDLFSQIINAAKEIDNHRLAKRIVTWREKKFYGDMPVSIRQEIEKSIANTLKKYPTTWNDCSCQITSIFNTIKEFDILFPVLSSSKTEPLESSEIIDEDSSFETLNVDSSIRLENASNVHKIKKPVKINDVMYINPCASIREMRYFVYQYCIQRGILPTDQEADYFVLNSAKNLFSIYPTPSRQGILFRTGGYGILNNLFNAKEFIANSPVYERWDL